MSSIGGSYKISSYNKALNSNDSITKWSVLVIRKISGLSDFQREQIHAHVAGVSGIRTDELFGVSRATVYSTQL